MVAGGRRTCGDRDRTYSGKFVARVPPELHRQLVIEAADQHVSLNRLISSRLGA